MPITVACPHCAKTLVFPDATAGKRGGCLGCRTVFLVPESSHIPASADPIEVAPVSPGRPVGRMVALAALVLVLLAGGGLAGAWGLGWFSSRPADVAQHTAEPTPPPIQPAPPPAPPVQAVTSGVLRGADNGRLVLDADGGEKVYSIPEGGISVTLDDKAARLEDVPKESTVVVVLKGEVVTSIFAASPPPPPEVTTTGKATRVGRDEIGLRVENGGVKSFRVPADAKVTVDDRGGALAVVRPGDLVTVVSRGGAANRIIASRPAISTEPPSLEFARPTPLTVKAGESGTLRVTVRRSFCRGAVHVEALPGLSQLTVGTVDIPAEGNATELSVSAAKDANPGPRPLRLKATLGSATDMAVVIVTVERPAVAEAPPAAPAVVELIPMDPPAAPAPRVAPREAPVPVLVLKDKNPAARAAYSPDGKTLVTGDGAGRHVLWNAATGEPIKTIESTAKGPVTSLSFAPDGKTFLSAQGMDLAGQKPSEPPALYGVETGKALREFPGGAGSTSVAHFSPDGKYVVTAGGDPTARLWEAATGKLLATFTGHVTGPVLCAAVSSDARLALTARRGENFVRVWDADGKEVKQLQGHFTDVTCVSVSADGRRALAGGDDRTVRLWDVKEGKELKRMVGHHDAVRDMRFTPDGRHALSAGGTDRSVRLWDPETGKETYRIDDIRCFAHFAALSADGKRFVTAADLGGARVWAAPDDKAPPPPDDFEPKMADGERRHMHAHFGAAWRLAFSADGKRLLSAGDDRTAALWDLDTGRQLCLLKGHQRPPHSVAFLRDGKTALTASPEKGDGGLRVWDLDTGKELRRFPTGPSIVLRSALSADGRVAATADGAGTVRIWDPDEGKLLHTIQGPAAALTWAYVFPDGSRVASGGFDGNLRLWDARTGDSLRAVADPAARICPDFNADGSRCLAAASDGTVQLRETGGMRILKTYRLRETPLTAASISPDGRRGAAGEADNVIRLWDLETGKEVARFGPLRGAVLYLRFSPDGTRLASADRDGWVRIWDVPK